ncbi:MAG: ABC transporter permease [Nakamurella sp.]
MTTDPAPPSASPSSGRFGKIGGWSLRVLSVHGLLILLVVLLIGFSILKPDTFPTAFNARSILSDKSIVALLALAEMIVIAAGHFDLSVGYGVGLAHILSIGLQTRTHLPWPLSCLIVIVVMVGVGAVNGLLVTRARIDSFIATLGVGTILFGVSSWYTGSQQVIGTLPSGFLGIAGSPGGIPLPAVYVVVIGILLWLVFEYLPLGRFLYVLGSNPKAAELTGISEKKYVLLAFMGSGLMTGVAGVVLGARLGVGQSSVGAEYLLPAFVGALLGSTSVRPGRVNVWGTVLAVLVLGVAVAGLQQEGAQFYVESLFNGAMLVLAVGLAAYAARRRVRIAARQVIARPNPPGTESDSPEVGAPAIGPDDAGNAAAGAAAWPDADSDSADQGLPT